eukprot:gene6093-7314_t
MAGTEKDSPRHLRAMRPCECTVVKCRWGVEASRRGVEASRWGVEASRWGVEASRWGVEAACPAAIALVERGAVESARHGGDAHRAEVLQERLAHTEAQWQAAAVVAATREAELKGQGMALVQAQARAQAAGAALLAERQAWHVQVFEARKTAQFLHNKLEHVTAQQANADGAAPARPAAAGALPSQEESQSQAAGTPKMAMPLNEPSPPEAEAASNEHSPPEVEAASNDHSPPEVETASKMCTPPKEESAKTKASKRMHRAAAVLLLSERDLHQQAQEAAEEEIRALMQQMGHLKLEAEHSNRALQQELRDVSIEWQKMVNCNDKKDEAIEKLR